MLDEHQYSIDLILFEAVPTFKLNTLLRKAHYEKSEGDPVTKTASIASTTAGFGRLPRGQKDAIYRLKNHPMVPWRAFFVDGYVAILETYAIRWTIAVFFQEMKQHLRLGPCPSRDFAAQIAHVTTCCIFYTFLANFQRVNAYQPLGMLFEGIVAEWSRTTWRNAYGPVSRTCCRSSWSRPRNRVASTAPNFNGHQNMPRSKRSLRSRS